jgi:U4/U6 small nuclear ribonucleoprotein PRP31
MRRRSRDACARRCLRPQIKKRRGGRRLRKMKERYGLTDVRKAANRMMFNQVEEEFMDGEDVSRPGGAGGGC